MMIDRALLSDWQKTLPQHPDHELQRRIAHAEAYPFARPACSFLFREGQMQQLPDGHFEGRVAVIASGSNAAPGRLAAKFGDTAIIPVTRAELRDVSVVFAGHFTAYGAIPATLHPSRGARTKAWITWLTAAQLAIMHRSEGVIGCREIEQRYDYVELAGLDLLPEAGPGIERAGAYLSRRMLAPGGQPVRFAEVVSRGCSLPALSERSMLRRAHQLLDIEVVFSTFMGQVLGGPTRRQDLFRRLTSHTIERNRSRFG